LKIISKTGETVEKTINHVHRGCGGCHAGGTGIGIFNGQEPVPTIVSFNKIWDLLVDLQKHITALTTTVNNIPAGPAGLSCWDLNADRVCNNGEDKNGDHSCNALDCEGPRGMPDPKVTPDPRATPDRLAAEL